MKTYSINISDKISCNKPHAKYSNWGMLEYLGQNTSPKYETLKEFNDNEKCWWRQHK